MKPRPLALKILDWLSVILLAVGTYLTIWWAPQEAVMGDVQRVFYFHVAAGWVGMIGFLLAVFAGIVYLIAQRHVGPDRAWTAVALVTARRPARHVPFQPHRARRARSATTPVH